MNNRFYTLILVPHSEGRFRKFHVSQRRLTVFASIAGAVLLFAVGLTFHYFSFYEQLRELRQLRQTNSDLRKQNLDYEVSTEHLNSRVASLQNFVGKLSIMAGVDLDPPAQAGGGMGGSLDVGEGSSDDDYSLVRESIQQMASELTSLEGKSRELERIYEDRTLMLASTPSIWPTRGYLSSSFGMRKDPFTGLRTMHQGVDISTQVGRPVVAPADGIVLFASRRGGYGNVIVIDHKFGFTTRYGHLQKFSVSPGKRVKRGDIIAYVGNTGKSNGPHLHYEVWVADRPTHPLNYILEYSKTFNAIDVTLPPVTPASP